MSDAERIYFRINGSLPTSTEVGELEGFILMLKNLGKDVFGPLPEASCRVAASYKDEDGDEVDISIWEKRPTL